jgi:TRAP-type mannitol/chloroaromatic compound transport system permease large subunit
MPTDCHCGCRSSLSDEFWVALVQAGLISPKSALFGISVFTVKSTLNDPNVSVESIFAGAMPYVAVMLIVLLLIAIFPSMALALI